MDIKYNIQIEDTAIEKNLIRITNQIYKLLPLREEGADWETPLSNIIEEIVGMKELLLKHQDLFFSLLCRLEGLYSFKQKESFLIYRRTIFECLNLVNEIGKDVINR